MISIGDNFPVSSFKVMGENGPTDLQSADIFPGKKVILFAVPGAFTPTCHLNHLPGYLDNYEILLSKGIDAIYIMAVNDVWVMNAWIKASGAEGKIQFLSDGSGAVTQAIGLDVDLSAAGMGLRSKRYSMLLDDGVVRSLNIEEKSGQAISSGAATILEQL